MDDVINIDPLLTDEQVDFCNFPLWNLPLVQYPSIEEYLLLESSSSSESLGNLNGLDELSKIFEEDIAFWNDKDHDKVDKSKVEIIKEKQIENHRNITFEEVSRYFYMPITQAARELNVGLTLLKKKCRELGIPRWPHRKMKSLQTLIRNVQELGGDEEEEQLRSAIEILEGEKRMMEKIPALQMEEKTKRLRQACFKANYKKRRLMAMTTMLPSSSSSSSSSCFSF